MVCSSRHHARKKLKFWKVSLQSGMLDVHYWFLIIKSCSATTYLITDIPVKYRHCLKSNLYYIYFTIKTETHEQCDGTSETSCAQMQLCQNAPWPRVYDWYWHQHVKANI